MPKKDKTQEALAALRTLDSDGPSAAGIEHVRALLGHRSNHVVGRAARLAGLWEAEELTPDLIEAFVRFTKSPVKTDPGCAAKQPVIGALINLGHNDPDIFLTGARYTQIEPAFSRDDDDPARWKPLPVRREWADPEPTLDNDTAATLRGMCGDGLLRCHYTDAHLVVAGLLMDPESRTRRIAMEALGATESYPSELLIRMALLAGDPEVDIMSLGLQGLMSIAPERSLEFVSEFLYAADPAIAEGAALAIGEARLPASFATLRTAHDRFNGPDLFTLALPMALTREDEAFTFLLDAVENASGHDAASAVEALAIFSGDEARVARVSDAARARGGPVLRAFRQHFEVSGDGAG